jgi:hypothetical protein
MRPAALVARLALLVASVGIAGVGTSACSSPAPSDAGTSPSDAGTSVSFVNDLMPLFQSSCSTSQGFTCHGDPSVETTTVQNLPNQPRPYYGPFLGKASTDVVNHVYTVLRGPSNEAPTLNYVEPGSLDQSFLWHKLKGDLTSITAKCTTAMAPPCGLVMPNDNLPLTSAQLQMISDWIQGQAPNN